MAGSSFGHSLVLTTFGESHGPAIGCVIDGCPPGIALAVEDFRRDIERRATGRSRHTSQRREADEVEILSGVYEGRSTGTPIALLIRNVDARSKDYAAIAERFRPGHADFTYWRKYGRRDPRGGGRSSARETVARVAAGVIAKRFLADRFGTVVRGCLRQVGPVRAEATDWDAVESTPLFWPEPASLERLEGFLDGLRKSGDSIGALVEVEAAPVPVGLGEPVFGRLDAELAAALMSINAVKAVEIGDGMAVVTQRGSEHRDELGQAGFLSNHSGGILGGISSGQPVRARLALKPTSSILVPGQTLDVRAESVEVVTKGRHDPCVGIRAVPIAEAMLAWVLADQVLRQRGQNADVRDPGPVLPGEVSIQGRNADS
ncbi:MAG: chorismate synthase [Xanthomonadales bacterium]|nr:chorismate synthase [Xanthomonadales bacterium]